MIRFLWTSPGKSAPRRSLRAVLLALPLALLPLLAALAQEEGREAPVVPQSRQVAVDVQGTEGELPAERKTFHLIASQGEELRFTAIAGSLVLMDEENEPEAEIAYVAYAREEGNAQERPVTFAVNGGPGAASAYLHLGALGPWILPMEGERILPSQSIALTENPESWLPFTDLVFIDPVGTGYSHLIDTSEAKRRDFLSIEGDIAALSRFITRWVIENGRLASPKYFVGESYGGFRGPLLAEALQTEQGIALRGMVLISPVLDFGWWSQPDHSPMPYLSSLPSLAAADMERRGNFSREELRAVEDYAAGDFVADFLRGVKDQAALDRLSDRMAAVTGLPRDLVRDHEGRLDSQTILGELAGEDDLVVSLYDTTVVADAPKAGKRRGHALDPVLDAMTAPLTSAMLAHYSDTLKWLPERHYHLLNRDINRAWNWGKGRRQAEAVTALQKVLALDAELRVLVAHGYTDLVTPYFASELILRQLRPFDPPGRVRQENFPGGHMFYTRSDSRRAFRDAAQQLYEATSRDRSASP